MVNDVAPQRKTLLNQKNGILERQLARGTNIPSRPANTPSVERLPRWNFPEWFIIAQTLLPGLLLITGSQIIRTPIRVAPYALSLLGSAFGAAGERRSEIIPAGGAEAGAVMTTAALEAVACGEGRQREECNDGDMWDGNGSKVADRHVPEAEGAGAVGIVP